MTKAWYVILNNNFTYPIFTKILSLLTQLIIFVFLANGLDKPEYALYASIVASTVLLVHFAAPGFTNLIVQNGSRGNEKNVLFIYKWGLVLAGVSCLPFSLIVLFSIDSLIGNAAKFSVVLFIMAEVFLNRVFDLGSSVLHYKSINKFFTLQFFYLLLRLVFVAIWYVLGWGTVEVLFYILFLANLIVTVMLHNNLDLRIKNISFSRRKIMYFLRKGLVYSTSITGKSVSSNADKVMYAGLGIAATGIADYSIASRLTYMAFIPFHTVITTLIPKLFQKGRTTNAAGLLSHYKGQFFIGLLLSITMCILVYNTIPTIIEYIDPKYVTASPIVKLMALYPIVLYVNMFLMEVLTCSNMNHTRMKIQISCSIIFIAICCLLIGSSGYKSGVYAFYISEVTLFSIVIFVIFKFKKHV